MRETDEHGNGETDPAHSEKEGRGRCAEDVDGEGGPYKVKKRPYKVKNVNSGTRNQKMEVRVNL